MRRASNTLPAAMLAPPASASPAASPPVNGNDVPPAGAGAAVVVVWEITDPAGFTVDVVRGAIVEPTACTVVVVERA